MSMTLVKKTARVPADHHVAKAKSDKYPPLLRAALALHAVYSPGPNAAEETVENVMMRWCDESGITLHHARCAANDAWGRREPETYRKQTKRLEAVARLLLAGSYAAALKLGQRVSHDIAAVGFSDYRKHFENICQHRRRPSVRQLYVELQGVADEFPLVTVNLEGRYLEVKTEPITLEGVDLGAFKIRVPFTALRRGNINNVRITGVDPSRAAAGYQGQHPHPHVNNGVVCWGAGAGPAAKFLSNGQLAPFFLTVRTLLETYNDNSPYVPIETWKFTRRSRCRNCNAAIGDDGIAECSGCGNHYCRECNTAPQQCGRAQCRQARCGRCRVKCPKCAQVVCTSCCYQVLNAAKTRTVAMCQDCSNYCRRCATGFERTADMPPYGQPWNCPKCVAAVEEAARVTAEKERLARASAEAAQRRVEERRVEERQRLAREAEETRQRVAAEARQRAQELAANPAQLAAINLIRADLGLPPMSVDDAVNRATAAVVTYPAPAPAAAPSVTPVTPAQAAPTCSCHECLDAAGRLDLCECGCHDE